MSRSDGRQWYGVTLDEAATRQRSRPVIESLRHAVSGWQRRFGLTAARSAVVGFSQGGVIAGGLLKAPALVGTAVLVCTPFPAEQADPAATQTVLFGDQDRFVSPGTVRERFGPGRTPGTRLQKIPGMGHEFGAAAAAATLQAMLAADPGASTKLARVVGR
jgi:predicted esterase